MTADAPSSGPRRFIFDISGIEHYLSQQKHYSGIQRVVATLIPHFFDILPEAEKAHMYYGVLDRRTGHYNCGRLRDIVDAMQDPQELRDRLHGSITRGPEARRRHRVLAKYAKSPIKFHFHKTRLDLLYLLGRENHFLRKNISRAQWIEIRRPLSASARPQLSRQRVVQVARPGDVMVLLDASWKPSLSKIFVKLAGRGLNIRVMVYDMIPICAPGYVVRSFAQTFALWLNRSTDYATSYITISHSVREELERFLRLREMSQPVRALPLVQSFPVRYTPAAHGPLADLIGPQDYPLFSSGLEFDDRLRALAQRPYVLCAGTIECRKNPLRLAQAWLRLIERGGGDVPKLVFAGRMGWMIDDFKALMDATGNLYGYAEIIEEPSDAELRFLYLNCLFLAMPSLYEGWGLPVGEALSFGKTALVSRCSSLPEVGQDLVEYCDPTSVRSIADAAWRLIETPKRREALEARITNTHLRTWVDVAWDLRAILVEA